MENMLRLWHIEDDEKYLLTLTDVADNDDQQLKVDKIQTIEYERKGKVLVAGTKGGSLVFWKNIAVGGDTPNDTKQWKP